MDHLYNMLLIRWVVDNFIVGAKDMQGIKVKSIGLHRDDSCLHNIEV